MGITSTIIESDASISSRRRFILQFAAAVGSVALGVRATYMFVPDEFVRHPLASIGDSSVGGFVGRASVGATIPTITFTQGVPGSISIAENLSGAEYGSMTVTKNAVPLPAGVTYDPATKSFIYDGVGDVSVTSGHILAVS